VKRLAVLLTLAAAALSVSSASATDWPNRPVRIVNPFAGGGAADVLARTVAEHLSAAFGQQFFVETRAGAAGSIGVQTVVASPPDGYNFVITNLSLLALLPVSNPKLGFDPKRDLTNVAYIAGTPVVLSVNPSRGFKTLVHFLSHAKSSPKPMTYSSSGVGSNGHLLAETFAFKTGIKVEHVPYKGAAQGLTDLVGGHIDFSSQTVASTSGQLRGGGLAGLAVTTAERLPDYPTIPTFKELGHPELVSTTWFSLSGPAGLPKDIVDKVNREVVRSMEKPEVQERLRRDGMIALPMSAEEFGRFIDEETARYRPGIERAGLIGK
jgi:tripartite-type tricarboxylate transporter receptor subunit TctC